MESLDYEREDFAVRARALLELAPPFEVLLRGEAKGLLESQLVGSELPTMQNLVSHRRLFALHLVMSLAEARERPVHFVREHALIRVHVGRKPELALSVELPAELAALLGDGARYPNGEFLLAASAARELRDRHKDWREQQWIPVASDGCGNYYVQVARGAIVFIESIGQGRYLAASSLDKLLEYLRAQPAPSLFDREATLRRDPFLVRFTDLAPLPWDG